MSALDELALMLGASPDEGRDAILWRAKWEAKRLRAVAIVDAEHAHMLYSAGHLAASGDAQRSREKAARRADDIEKAMGRVVQK